MTTRPFLRWAGGKQWLVPVLSTFYTRDTPAYFEPFLGGGSVFFGIRPAKAFLGDINPRLINTYSALGDNPQQVVRWLSLWPNTRTQFNKIRSLHITGRYKAAAQFIYLNKTCWNGLYRVDRKGQFNVPYGNNPSRRTHEPADLLEASRLLRLARLAICDFEDLLSTAQPGDFVYLDPPYTVLHSNNGFLRYNERLFSWDDQQRLASTARRLSSTGCRVVVSNANYPELIRLYKGFTAMTLQRKSLLAASSKHRHRVTETLLVSSSLRHKLDRAG